MKGENEIMGEKQKKAIKQILTAIAIIFTIIMLYFAASQFLLNEKDDSIEFTKEYFYNGEYIKVAIRVSSSNIYYARSMYVLNNNRVKNFITKGTLKKLDS